MKNTFLDNIITEALATCRRFVLPIVFATIGVVAAMVLSHVAVEDEFFAKILVTVTLAFPISLVATIFAERLSSRMHKTFVFLGTVVFIALYHFLYIEQVVNSYHAIHKYKHALWFIASICLVTFIAFIRKISSSSLEFWNYNKKIAYALIATAIYSAAIQIGLSVALLTTNFLFDLDLSSLWWTDLFTIVAGLFAPIFFLARFPKIDELEDVSIAYPKELRLFSFYILAPLVCIYFLILYTYTAKILLTQEWPNGTVSYLILGFSALGILTYMIVYPLMVADSRVKAAGKIFFTALIPQVAVLFWAVWLRVSEYGITEKRYLLMVGGLWLLSTSLYFLLSKVKRLKMVPLSLFVIFVVTSFGPWGMFTVSEKSQIARLAAILERHGALVDGYLVPSPEKIADEDGEEVVSILSYLYTTYGYKGIESWFKTDMSLVPGDACRNVDCYTSSQITEYIGINYRDYSSDEDWSVYINRDDTRAVLVTGYDYYTNTYEEMVVNGDTYHFTKSSDGKTYIIQKNEQVLVEVPLHSFIDKVFDLYEKDNTRVFTQEDMSLVYEDRYIKLKIIFDVVQGQRDRVWTSEDVLVSVK